jgi:hypothetical protein
MSADDARQAVVWQLYQEAVLGLDTQVGALIDAAESGARDGGHDLLVVFTSAQGIELAGFAQAAPSAVRQPFGLSQGLSRHLVEVPVVAAWWTPASGWDPSRRALPFAGSAGTPVQDGSVGAVEVSNAPVSAMTFLPRLLDALAVEYGPALRPSSDGSWSRLAWQGQEETSWLSPSGEQHRRFADGHQEWSLWRADGSVESVSAPVDSPPPAPALAPLLVEATSLPAGRLDRNHGRRRNRD